MRLIHLADGVSPLAGMEIDGEAAATWSRWQNRTCPGRWERTGRRAAEPFIKTHASTLGIRWKPCISVLKVPYWKKWLWSRCRCWIKTIKKITLQRNAHSLYSETVPLNEPSVLTWGCDVATMYSQLTTTPSAQLILKHTGWLIRSDQDFWVCLNTKSWKKILEDSPK